MLSGIKPHVQGTRLITCAYGRLVRQEYQSAYAQDNTITLRVESRVGASRMCEARNLYEKP